MFLQNSPDIDQYINKQSALKVRIHAMCTGPPQKVEPILTHVDQQ